MQLMINHQTHYQYTEPASNSVQYIKMQPVSSAHQHVLHWNISVPGERQQHKDVFHNEWLSCTQRFSYQHMSIMAQGVVDVNLSTLTGPDTGLNPWLFLQPTPSTQHNAEMHSFAHEYVSAPDLKQLERLAEAVLNKMPYSPFSTSVSTSAIEAFQHGEGVCQDHSHVFIAMCKLLRIPARYVSGYLYANNSSHLASHAWAEAYIDHRWYCFDVTNQVFSPASHVYVATGRDYWDVAPVRGMREMGGVESMQSIVQVLRC